MPNTIKTTHRIFGGHYVVVTEAGVTYVVYQRDGLWWAKHQGTLQIVDSAPTKAQLLRSIENVE